MPPSDNFIPASLNAVLSEVSALETHCGELDQYIAAANWDGIRSVLQQTRRSMHALQNAMADEGIAGTPGFTEHVMARLERVHAYRQAQLERLESVRDGIGERLRTIARFKGYARAIGAKPAPVRPRALDSFR